MVREATDLRAELARFTTPRCRMAHEQVARDPVTRTPVRNDGSDSGYTRLPLCPAARRASNLACGHTNARNRFVDLLRALPGDRGDAAPVRALVGQAEALDLETALLDHRKGDAELALAQALDAGDPGAVTAARATIAALEAEHDGVADRWRALQAAALALLG